MDDDPFEPTAHPRGSEERASAEEGHLHVAVPVGGRQDRDLVSFRPEPGDLVAGVDPDPPVGAPLISSVRPNPSMGGLTVELSLAGDEPASLHIFDAAGRLRLRRSVEAGAGAHSVRFVLGSELGSGVYWIVLDQAGRSSKARFVLAR